MSVGRRILTGTWWSGLSRSRIPAIDWICSECWAAPLMLWYDHVQYIEGGEGIVSHHNREHWLLQNASRCRIIDILTPSKAHRLSTFFGLVLLVTLDIFKCSYRHLVALHRCHHRSSDEKSCHPWWVRCNGSSQVPPRRGRGCDITSCVSERLWRQKVWPHGAPNPHWDSS